MLAYLACLLAMTISGVLLAYGGWFGGLGAGIILGIALVVPWFIGCLILTKEHQEGRTLGWMVLIWGRRKSNRSFGYLYKIGAVILFGLTMFIGIFGNINNEEKIHISFPIFLGLTWMFVIFLVERYFKRNYSGKETQRSGRGDKDN